MEHVHTSGEMLSNMDHMNPFEVITSILYPHIDQSKTPVSHDGLYLRVTNQAAIRLFDTLHGVTKDALVATIKEDTPDMQLEKMFDLLSSSPELWGKLLRGLINAIFLVLHNLEIVNEEEAYDKLQSFLEIYEGTQRAILK